MLIVVPSRDRMYARLKELGGDWFADHIIPTFEKYVGQELEPEGVELICVIALDDAIGNLELNNPTRFALSMYKPLLPAVLKEE